MRRFFAGVLVLVALFVSCAADAKLEREEAAIAAARERAREWLLLKGISLGIGDPDRQLQETSAQKLHKSVVIRYRHMYEGVPVYAGNLVLLVYESGEVSPSGGLRMTIQTETTPKITAREAETIVLTKWRVTKKPNYLETTLYILPKSRLGPDLPPGDRLVWEVSLATDKEPDGAIDRDVLIDAQTGEIWSDVSGLVNATYVASGPYAHGAYFQGSVRVVGLLNKTQTGLSQTYVQDYCYGHGLPVSQPTTQDRCTHPDPAAPNYLVVDGRGNWVGDANNRDVWTGKPLEYLSASLGDGTLGSTNVRTPAADAIHALEDVFDYLYFYHQRLGLDRNNGPLVYALVRAPIGRNAAWSSKNRAIQLGIGDGEYYHATTIDIVAHEIGHALSDYGPRLSNSPETAAIGEATANMFAMLVSERFHPEPIPHWIGEQAAKANYVGSVFTDPTRAFTYMDDPARSPGTVVCYYPEIRALERHRGAGPGNHMFYLLTYGGTSACDASVVEGIGVDAAERIWYQAFHALPDDATYISLRHRFVGAAMDLYPGPSLIVQSTVAAFDAVNVP